jgi:hypothetical protein
MKLRTFFRLVPFFILGGILIVTWYAILKNDYTPSNKHWAALILFVINLVFYFFTTRHAVLLTGVILILAVFNVLAFFVDISFNSFFIKFGRIELSTPDIQWKAVILLLFYCIVNGAFIRRSYSARKK